MNTKFAALTILLTATAVFGQIEPHPSWSNLVANASFELPVLASGANHVVPASELTPWQTTEGAFLVWVSPLPNEQAPEGRQHLEVVSVWQTVTTVPGEDYRLSFFHAPRPGVDSALSVSINGQTIRTFIENGAVETGFKWTRFTTNFTAAGEGLMLRFDGIGSAGNAHLDAVVLERLPLRSSLRVSEVEFAWESVTGRTYTVQYKSTVTGNVWTDLFTGVEGNGSTNRVKDLVPADEPQRFYRVILP